MGKEEYIKYYCKCCSENGHCPFLNREKTCGIIDDIRQGWEAAEDELIDRVFKLFVNKISGGCYDSEKGNTALEDFKKEFCDRMRRENYEPIYPDYHEKN